jgi:microcystin degradation protein MlrC
MDLHANLTQRRMQTMDLLVGYATNPHRDHVRTAKLAGKLLLRALRGEVRPTTAWRSLPLLVGGGTTLDFLPAMLGIFRRMRALERRGEVLTASVFMCHVWNDDPDLGWSVVVTTDDDQAKAERLAEELADRCWEVRHKQPPEFASAEEAVAQAQRMKLRRKLGTITLADASDVVTAGAPGDTTCMLRALLEGGQGLRAYLPMRDPRAVAQLWNEDVGSELTLEVGGSLDPEVSDALEVTGVLRRKQEVPGMKRQCVLRSGDIELVITEGPPVTIRPSFFSDVGLDPWKADVLVVKNFFPFRLFFLPHSRKTLYVKTKGRTDIDAAFGLEFNEPLHPIAEVAEWRPTDARRRGLAAPAE